MDNSLFSNKNQRRLLIGSVFSLSLTIRLLFLYIPSPDISSFNSIWYDVFIKIGRIDAFKTIFYNYSPAYLYLLDITTLFRFIPKETAIKLIPIFFDYFAALAVYKIVGLKYNAIIKWLGFFVTLFAPTVFIESSMWGQVDIIYTSFLLWALYFLLTRKNLPSIISFAIAFCFKSQAIFFAPIYLLLLFRKKINFWSLFLIPIIYFFSLVPAWIIGSPIDQLIQIYFSQAETYNVLSMRAPNIYMFIPNDPGLNIKIWIGIIFTCLLVISYISYKVFKNKQDSIESLFFDTCFFTFFIPFFLPKMHERYFFTAAIFMIVFAFFYPKITWASILLQASSLISYIPYFSGWSDNFAKIGSILNILLAIGFIISYRNFANQENNSSQIERQKTSLNKENQ